MGQPKPATIPPTAPTPSQLYADATSTSQKPQTQSHFITPSNYRVAIYAKLDHPYVSLFRLGIRTLQFVFALASGVSYSIELEHGNVDAKTDFIYAEVVFGLTLVTLILDSITVRSYKFTWMVEWTLSLLWFVLFAVFYQIYFTIPIEIEYSAVDVGRMKRAIWMDLINALLWFGSALFSSAMCCAGIKAAVKGKLEKRRQRRAKPKVLDNMSEMEEGTIRDAPAREEERLPTYEEVPVEAHQ